jgi:hypothetical protein
MVAKCSVYFAVRAAGRTFLEDKALDVHNKTGGNSIVSGTVSLGN